MSQTLQAQVLHRLFQTHSATTFEVAALAGGDRNAALRALRALVRLGAVSRSLNEWDGVRYEDRRRVPNGSKFSDTCWQINVEPDGQVTLDTVKGILARVRRGEVFEKVSFELTNSN